MKPLAILLLCLACAGCHAQANTKEAGRRLWIAGFERDVGCVSFALSPITAGLVYAYNHEHKSSAIAAASWFFSVGIAFQFGANRQERKAAILLQQWP